MSKTVFDEYSFRDANDGKGGIILTKYLGSKENVVIPAVYEGRPVVGLEGTFDNGYYSHKKHEIKTLRSVIIPDGVTIIGKSTFLGCGSLESVTIPDSVTSIGDNAFASCSNLKRITIPDSVTSIGEDAFRDSGVEDIKLPK